MSILDLCVHLTHSETYTHTYTVKTQGQCSRIVVLLGHVSRHVLDKFMHIAVFLSTFSTIQLEGIVQPTLKLKSTHLLLTSVSMEALVTFPNPQNSFTVSQFHRGKELQPMGAFCGQRLQRKTKNNSSKT